MLRTGRTSGSGTSQRSRRPGAAAMTTRSATWRWRAGASGVNRGAEPRSVFQRVMVRSIAKRTTGRRSTSLRHTLPVPPRPGRFDTAQTRSRTECVLVFKNRGFAGSGYSYRSGGNERVVILRWDAPEPDRLAYQGGDALGPHLFHDLGAVALDGAYADVQLGGDRVTREPFHNEIENFDLSGRQSGELFVEGVFRLVRPLLLEPVRQGPVDRGNELSVVNRLFNEIFSPGLDGCHSHRHIRVTGNENDRERDIAASKLADEAQAVRSGHSHIGDDASNIALIELVQKSVGRFVGLDGVTEHAEHLAERVANRRVIVDDQDCRGRHCTTLAVDRAATKTGILFYRRHRYGARHVLRGPRQSTR